MAAILGLDPWRNAYDIWLDKTDKLEDREKESAVMTRGNFLESAILNWAEHMLGPIVRNQYRSAKEIGLPLGSNDDAILVETNEPIEGKSQGHNSKEHWGEAGSDEVPDRVVIQAHVQIMCSKGKADYCHIPAYLPYREFQMFGVGLDKDLEAMIAERAIDFWNNHVLKDIPPENVIPSLNIIKRMRREPKTVVPVSDELIDKWRVAIGVLKKAVNHKKEVEAEILTALGTAEGGECTLGKLTYYETYRKGYEVKPVTFRTLRLKVNKEDKGAA